jgi:superfamily II DNA helicase RecQ
MVAPNPSTRGARPVLAAPPWGAAPTRQISGAPVETLLDAYEHRREGDRRRLESMMQYAEMTGCRVRHLKTYLGEPTEDSCGHCDNCRHPERRFGGEAA